MCFVLLNDKTLLGPLFLRHTKCNKFYKCFFNSCLPCFFSFFFLMIFFVNLFMYRLRFFFYQDFQLFYFKTRLHCQMDQIPCTQDKLSLHVINIANHTLLANLFLLCESEKEKYHDKCDLLTTMDRVVFTRTLEKI